MRARLRPITVTVRPKVLVGFEWLCIEAFPRELWGALIGFRAGNHAEITEIWLPGESGTPNAVEVKDHWLVEAEAHASEVGAELIGDIHSHPWTWEERSHWRDKPGRNQSESDLDFAPQWDALAGIVNVLQSKSGALRASTRIWGPTIPVVMRRSR